jgi:hypothetical protein
MFALTGCDSAEEKTFQDEGALCMQAPEGTSLAVTVQFPTCLSSSCDTVRSASCKIAVDGQKLIVTSSGTVESEGGSCTDDCGLMQASCQVGGLAPGKYTITHGSESQEITLPFNAMQLGTGIGVSCR